MNLQRRIGQHQVSPIGLGAMPLSMGGNQKPSEEQAIATVHAALDAGVTLIDTADIYAPSWDSMGHNERIVAKALRSYDGDTSRVRVATKAGITRGEGESWGRDSSPEYLRRRLEEALSTLGVDRLDLFYLHRPDRSRVYSTVMETFGTLKAEGLISEIGISNANVEEIRIAIDVLGEGELAAVQNEFSPKFNHTSKPELDFCAEHGIAFLPWSPLGGTGGAAKQLDSKYPVIARIAAERGVSPQQVTLAWELSLGSHVIPIPGASRPESITDSAKAMRLELSDEETQEISEAVL
ncbi:aldo/keto reductase [Tessaracoccus flavus]|uniref:Aldo/keto reductase n=1 Tax=Tessaracoccus flavus TaxID=1610493 RepID=A0A1Q2CE81_9ACTN|nr:aldo/keto reductase [Tessaracoccus flavus]AQP44380.1 aldo/keto reductase [Tessaracoccus flavus]